MEVPKAERRRTGLLALMNPGNSSVISMRVFRTLGYRNPTTLQFGLDNNWFHTGVPLAEIADFLRVVAQLRRRK
jgi:glycerol kinase